MKNVERIYNLIKKFEDENNSKTTAVLFKEEVVDEYRLMIASECLNDLSPFDSVLEVVKYIHENDKKLFRDLQFNISTVHTSDETINSLRESFEENSVKHMNEAELFYATLSDVYVML